MRTRNVFAVAALTALVLGAAWWTLRDSGEPAKPADSRERSNDRRNDHPIETVLRAADIGLVGWQPASERSKDSGSVRLPGSEDRARGLASGHGSLQYIAGAGDSSGGVSGLLDAQDTSAVAESLLIERVHCKDLDAVPPTADLEAMASLAARVVPLVGRSPNGECLVGGANSCRAALESAASEWPASARVHKVMLLPPDAPERGSMTVRHEAGSGESRAEALLLREAGLAYEQIAGGSVTARATIRYQNEAGQDRSLAVQLNYDKGTGEWVLFKVSSLPSSAETARLARAGDFKGVTAQTYSLPVQAILGNSRVTTDGTRCLQ